MIKVLKTPLGKIKIYEFGSNGETILITSGIHGDEHNSIATVRNLIKLLKKTRQEKFKGKIMIIPIANPNAFKYKKRKSLIDETDLNRVFPGDPEGTATQRHAALIWEIAQEADYILDIHTCGYCLPYTLTLHLEYKGAKGFAEKLPIENVVESSGLGGQLFIEALKIGKKAAIIELPQDAFKINTKLTETLSRELIQALKNLEIIEGEKKRYKHTYLDKIKIQHADKTGLFKPKKKLGDRVEKEEVIGKINGKPVKSKHEGKIISLQPTKYVHTGEKIAGITKPLNPASQ